MIRQCKKRFDVEFSNELDAFIDECFKTGFGEGRTLYPPKLTICDIMEWCDDDHPMLLAECDKLYETLGDFDIFMRQ